MRRPIWWITQAVLSVAVLAGGYFAITNARAILDWWQLRSYTPPAEVVRLADATTMQGQGRDLFYISDPHVQDREAFNQTCTDAGEQSLVLGCYKSFKIYIYNVGDPRLAGVKEVTAAHEMLHAAYQRLPATEKAALNDQLRVQMNALRDERLQKLIQLYNEQEPGELLNEMHSILGTEYPNLSPELEAHYKRYFAERAKVVAYAQQYEGIFTASKERLAVLDEQLGALKVKIDANNAQLQRTQQELETQMAQMNATQQTDPAAYNQMVPSYNVKVRQFNNLVVTTRQLVNQYNALVQERNSEAAAQNDLFNSLDSTYQPVQSP